MQRMQKFWLQFPVIVHFTVTLVICRVSGMLCERWYVLLKRSWIEKSYPCENHQGKENDDTLIAFHKSCTLVLLQINGNYFLEVLTATTPLSCLLSPFLLLSYSWACSPSSHSKAMGHKDWDMTVFSCLAWIAIISCS